MGVAAAGEVEVEAAVAALLADDRALDTIAGRIALTIETVRTYVKRIYAKTAVASQAALVALVLRSRS